MEIIFTLPEIIRKPHLECNQICEDYEDKLFTLKNMNFIELFSLSTYILMHSQNFKEKNICLKDAIPFFYKKKNLLMFLSFYKQFLNYTEIKGTRTKVNKLKHYLFKQFS